jgi:hypothetical protein
MVKFILYPYVLWSSLQGVVNIALSEYTNRAPSYAEILGILLHPVAQFWFLWVLLLSNIVYYICNDSCKKILVWASFVLFGVVAVYWRHLPRDDYGTFKMFSYGLAYFMLGTVSVSLVSAISGRRIVYGSAILFTLLSSLYFQSEVITKIAIPCALAGIVLIISYSRHFGRQNPLLAAVGQYSMGIYVMHIFVVSGLRIVLRKGVGMTDPVLHLMFGTVLGVVVPMAVLAILSKLGIESWFGLPRVVLSSARKRECLAPS